MNLTEICRTYSLHNNEGIDIQAGTLSLQVRRMSMGWGFRSDESADAFDDVKVVNNNSAIQVSESALFQTGKSDDLVVLPALPTKPLVLKNSGLRILPGQNMRFFVKIPLWLQFYHSGTSPEHFITEYPLFKISDTWFGEPDEGEPALALGNFYQKDASLLDLKPWEAICPVHITNHSGLLLEVQRFIIRVENLSLVVTGNQLMTSLTEIEYKGREQISSATYHLNKTVHGDDYHQIAPPRNAGTRSSLKINFHFIKNIYQI